MYVTNQYGQLMPIICPNRCSTDLNLTGLNKSKTIKYGIHTLSTRFFQKQESPCRLYDSFNPYPDAIRNIETPIPPKGVNNLAPSK